MKGVPPLKPNDSLWSVTIFTQSSPLKFKIFDTHTITHTYCCVQYILYSILGPTINQHIPYRFNLCLELILRSKRMGIFANRSSQTIPNSSLKRPQICASSILGSALGGVAALGVPKCLVCCRIISKCVDNCRSFAQCYHIQLPFFRQVRLH